MLQVLIPLQSRTPFYPKEEFYFPKPLVEIQGRPMVEWVIEGITNSFGKCKFIFIVDKHDVDEYSLDGVLLNAAGGDSTIIKRNGPTSGAVCSSLLAIDAIEDNDPLLISNGDQFVNSLLATRIQNLNLKSEDGAVVTFPSLHPRWCYANVSDGKVLELHEKKVVSKSAVAGLYYFAEGRSFKTASEKAIINGFAHDDIYYLSGAMNQLILNQGEVHNVEISETELHTFYDPAQIRNIPLVEHNEEKVNVVIPAAGEGSRFAKAGWLAPKPAIDLNGKPMLAHVVENFRPSNANVTIIVRKEVRESISELNGFNGCSFVELNSLTEGTASTILHCREYINNNAPLLIANSDQLVDFDVNTFIQDCSDRSLDGSILVFRDKHKDPKWSFAKLKEDGLVTEVAEKKPISDLATVGIYLFSRGSDFVASAIDMIVNNERVNNEFYTCPVYNYMIRNGAKIGVFEVDQNHMHGLGTPNDFQSYISRKNLPTSKHDPKK
jgi:NDP-sugar pyrophosphorylase family protein